MAEAPHPAKPWRRALTEAIGKEPHASLRLGIASPGVFKRRRRLKDLMGDGVNFVPVTPFTGSCDAVAGWGLKGKGRDKAQRLGVPYLALEDSFLARLGSGEGPYGLLGLSVDTKGVYYDASRPTLVESLIAESVTTTPLQDAEHLLAYLRATRLSKFNTLDPKVLEQINAVGAPYQAIVVDQIANDLSIKGGFCEASTFEAMLDEAIVTYGADAIAVKLHPYDGVDGRHGHLRALAAARGVTALPSNANWLACAEKAEQVFVATSNAGLEALIVGTPVTCFGAPFFAGWGLTDDRLKIARRKARPTLPQLIYASYEQYGLSWLPSLNRSGSAMELARFLAANQSHARLFGAGLTMAGFSAAKRHYLKPFLGPWKPPLRTHPSPKLPETKPRAVWASRVSGDARLTDEWRSEDGYFVEDGFIRSVGLGAELVRPASLNFDPYGIYYDASAPSAIEQLLQQREFRTDELARARSLIDMLRQKQTTKYNLKGAMPAINAQGRKILLVPGQVEDDASIRMSMGSIKTNRDLLLAARRDEPEAFIIYKPHPDVEIAGRPGYVPDAEELADAVIKGVAADAAMAAADGIATMTSLMGFEALLRDLKVRVYGSPFYAGWGLTEDAVSFDRRGHQRTLEELVAAAMIEAPLYISPLTNVPCGVEDTVEALSTSQPGRSSIVGGQIALRLWRRTKRIEDKIKARPVS